MSNIFDEAKSICPLDETDVVVYSLGCKTNQYEGEALVAEFGKLGVRASDCMKPAKVYIINTCSVTVEADRKSRQVCRRARSLNPNAAVYVCGCAVANCSDEYFAGAKVIAGAMDKTKIACQVVRWHSFFNQSGLVKPDVLVQATGGNLTGANFEFDCHQADSKASLLLGSDEDKVAKLPLEQRREVELDCTIDLSKVLPIFNAPKRARKHIKIQDGCNDFCSFCIIPFLRGRSRSRDVKDVVDEIASTNVNEIVLTGINITRYGLDNGCTLTQLIQSIKTDARIRISSIECNAIEWDLLDAMLCNNGCNHFHLSLQSGSDKVLRAMNRKYSVEHFEQKVKLIRRMMGDNTAITTDLIVGYPTESQKDFEDTLDFVDKIKFSDVHAFKFSPRPKTVAARLPQLAPQVVDERFERLKSKVEACKQSFLKAQVGLQHEVVFENAPDGIAPIGYTRNYCKVTCDKARANSIAKVTIDSLQGDTLIAKVATLI